jgi:hypothetical protein
MAKLMQELPHPLFGDIGDQLYGTGKGVLSLPYKAIQYFFPSFGGDETQTTGDCVSHATRNAVDITRAYEILYGKEKESFIARGATEPIYGSRGSSGQGMQCSQAARFVSTTDKGMQVELTRREKKIDCVGTGIFEWYADDLADILEYQILNELPEFAKAEVAKDLIAQARAKAQATLANVRAMKARVTPVVTSTVNPDLTGM